MPSLIDSTSVDTQNLIRCHALLRLEIQRRMATSDMWSGLPGLLDELHRLRSQCTQAHHAPAGCPGPG